MAVTIYTQFGHRFLMQIFTLIPLPSTAIFHPYLFQPTLFLNRQSEGVDCRFTLQSSGRPNLNLMLTYKRLETRHFS